MNEPDPMTFSPDRAVGLAGISIDSLLENVTDLVAVLGNNGWPIYISPSIQRQMGYETMDDLIANSRQMLHPDDRIRAIKIIRICKTSIGVPHFWELRIRNRSGDWRRHEGVASAYLDDKGGGIIVSARDVTGGSQRISELGRLSTALNSIAEGVIMTDPDGIVQYANPSFSKLSGYPAEEIIGRPCRMLSSDAFDHSIFQDLRADPGPGRSWKQRCFGRTHDGSRIEMDVSLTPLVIWGGGEVDGFVAVIRDITGEVSVQRSIERAKRQWETTVDALSEIIVIADSSGTVMRCNDAATVFLGRTYPDIVGRHLGEVFGRQPISGPNGSGSKAATIDRIHIGFATTGTVIEIQGRMFEVKRHELALAEDVEHVFVLNDITKWRDSEAALRASQRQLRQLAAHIEEVREEEKSRIAREVHDELGQAATVLLHDLSRIREVYARRKTGLRDAIEDVRGSVIQIADISRRIATELRPAILDHLGLAAAIEWQTETVASRTGLVAKIDVPLVTPPMHGAHATALFRIFQELLTNVVRHAQARSVEVRLVCEGKKLILRVIDDGIGIEPADRSKSASLGLVGMRERALSCGGSIELKKKVGSPGTVAEVVIPLSDEGDSG